MRFIKLTLYRLLHVAFTGATLFFMLAATLQSDEPTTQEVVQNFAGFLAGLLGSWILVLSEQRFLH